jgi:hypothetical protein
MLLLLTINSPLFTFNCSLSTVHFFSGLTGAADTVCGLAGGGWRRAGAPPQPASLPVFYLLKNNAENQSGLSGIRKATGFYSSSSRKMISPAPYARLALSFFLSIYSPA